MSLIVYRKIKVLSKLLVFVTLCISHSIIYAQPGLDLKCPPVNSEIYNPASNLKELFRAVQISGIFSDSKTFVDCTPLIAADSISYLYLTNKDKTGFSLDSLVKKYFKLPENYNSDIKKEKSTSIIEYLESMWNNLQRTPEEISSGTLLPLSYPYIVPGGRFREIYYWDSYFTMEGLAASGRIDLIRDMLNNFACLIEQFGYIPNGNRSYYLGRSQPPFFAEMIKLYMRETDDSQGIKYLPVLEQEYKFWMDTPRLRKIGSDAGYLNHYNDQNNLPRPEAYKEDYNLVSALESNKQNELCWNIRAACESGWDYSSRWLADGISLSTIHTTDILPVDLNTLLFNIEITIANLYKSAGNIVFSSIYYKKAESRKQLILKYFWNEKKGFFYDYDSKTQKQLKIESLAAVYPLYFRIATPAMANKVAERLRNDFLRDGGLMTSLQNTGQQWDAPNGWAPLQWMAVIGLENYGIKSLADSIAQRWMALNEKVYNKTGKMMEKYNVSDTTLEAGGGEYPGQDGFGWTNGVYLGLYKKGYR